MAVTTPMKRVRIRVASLVLALLMVAGLAVTNSPPASAGSHSWFQGYVRPNATCAGLGFTGMIRNEQIAPGIYLRVYYGTRDGGTNCANLINTTGRPQNLSIYISHVDAEGGGAMDWGYYRSYAGSVLVRGTAGLCIDLYATVNGRETARERVHCG